MIRIGVGAGLLLVGIAILIGLLLLSQVRTEPPKVSGFIEADEIRLGSRVGGRVALVHVREGERVKQGQVLVELEPFDLREREQQALAELAARRAEYERLESGLREEEIQQARARYEQLQAHLAKLEAGPRPQEIKGAEAQLLAAEARLRLAQQSHERTREVFARGAATSQEMDRATETLREARALVTVRQQELALLEAGTRKEELEEAQAQLEAARAAWELARKGYRTEEIAAARAAADAAAAALGSIRAQIEELHIQAPVDGTVEAMELQKGDLVPQGAPVISIMDEGHLWVRAYVPENRLDLQLGDRLRVQVDSYPDRTFPGTVTFISRQAEFTPSNVQTPEERVKQVFRIKVSLKEGAQLLRPGMSADVWLQPIEQSP